MAQLQKRQNPEDGRAEVAMRAVFSTSGVRLRRSLLDMVIDRTVGVTVTKTGSWHGQRGGAILVTAAIPLAAVSQDVSLLSTTMLM